MDNENSLKAKMQQQQERLQRAKVEEFRVKKQMAAREDIARQIAEEEELIRQKEAEVMQMEMLEMELIKKLQNTQAIQKMAYVELEEAINSRPMGMVAPGGNNQSLFRHKNGGGG